MSQKKKIIQFSLSGEFIKEYDSIIEAERSNLITGIMHVLNGKHFHAGGYIWKYSEQLDIREKNSQATLNEEKAREIRARADILDKQFLDDMNGKKREDKLEDELIKENARISTINHKAMVDLEKKRIEESSYAGSSGEQSSNQYVEPEM